MVKPRRIVDHDLLAFVKTLPCVACGGRGGDAHHVRTRGAGGDDVPTNLMPLCRWHHTMLHQLGPSRMIAQFPGVGVWLQAARR